MKKGFHHKETIWEEKDKEIKALLTSRLTVKDIWKDNRRKINYLIKMNIDDARVWFGYRSKMTVRVKANRLNPMGSQLTAKFLPNNDAF